MDSLNMLDKLQAEVLKDSTKKSSDKKEYNFDKLRMYFGEDYEVKGIKISMPKMGDILRIGEDKFYAGIAPFTDNSTSIRVLLWDLGKDWTQFSDIEIFSLLIQSVVNNKEPLNLLFKTIDIFDFELRQIKRVPEQEEYEFVLYSPKQDILLYEEDFMEMAEYIRELLNFHPKVEKPTNKTAKKWMIQEDKMNAIVEKAQNKKHTSALLPLVSTLVNHPGFKYKLNELKDVGIYQFMDSVKRIQIYESSIALTQGSYSGFCDVSKIDKKQFDFMRQIDD